MKYYLSIHIIIDLLINIIILEPWHINWLFIYIITLKIVELNNCDRPTKKFLHGLPVALNNKKIQTWVYKKII